jgi:hypothetical protein
MPAPSPRAWEPEFIRLWEMLTDELSAQIATTFAHLDAQLRQGYQDCREAVRALRASDRRDIRLRPLLDLDLLLGIVAFLIVLGVLVWPWHRRR